MLQNSGAFARRERGLMSIAVMRERSNPPVLAMTSHRQRSFPAQAGNPVSRGFSAQATVSGILGHPPSRVTTSRHRSAGLTDYLLALR
jgi:hypothetical protein